MSPKFEIGKFLPEGSRVKSLSVEAPEDLEDKKARLFRERWSFLAKEVAMYCFIYVFLFCVLFYSFFVVAKYGSASPEAKNVLPFITTLLGGVLGVIVGRAAK